MWETPSESTPGPLTTFSLGRAEAEPSSPGLLATAENPLPPQRFFMGLKFRGLKDKPKVYPSFCGPVPSGNNQEAESPTHGTLISYKTSP